MSYKKESPEFNSWGERQHFPDIHIIATGSSTLYASRKFKDTLTGRKIRIHLPPMLFQESSLFGNDNINHRMLFGGLPPFFLSSERPDIEFEDWITDYWSKEVQALYRLGRPEKFIMFTEHILAQSGGMFDATKFAESCEVSRPTITNYLSILKDTYVAYAVRPFSKHAPTEIRSTPKVYGFDTGFICYMKKLERNSARKLWIFVGAYCS